jgi:hypothetical protein
MNYIITDRTITFFAKNKPRSLHRDNVSQDQWDEALIALKEGNTDLLLRLTDMASVLVDYTDGEIEIINGNVHYDGELLDNYPAKRMIEFMRGGLPFGPLAAFIKRLMHNTSYRVREQLYGFLESSSMPITEDGYFLAYKKVRSDYMDIHSGTFRNAIGDVCEMPRFKVDDNPNNTCSAGLHVCSYSYLPHFGSDNSSTVMVVKVDPSDVVSVPTDYNNAKMRVCKYEVIDEIKDYKDEDILGNTMIWSDDEEYDEEYDEDEECDGTECDCKCGIW